MPLTIYNTLTRKKEKFVPFIGRKAGMYACGPTVYNYAHIGNLRSYIFEDLLKRTLFFNRFKVKHVMNITDVGHLTSDADLGEDKMLLAALRENKSIQAIADFYTKAFKEDLKRLNVIGPKVWCKATEHIKEQIGMIKKLEKEGYTYFAGGNVYFDTSTADDYGKLAQLDLNAEAQARVKTDPHKRNPHDFVLWFTKSKFQEQEMKWDSPWGKGYPGWHIECSAMATKYLGKQFDLHCGGIDHVPVHHTNEIAQSEAALGKKPWVKYWLHGEFLVVKDGEKMAKSGGNFITLPALSEKGFDPLDYRYLCLGTHYRKQLRFSYEALEGAKAARKKLEEKFVSLASGKPAKEQLFLWGTNGRKPSHFVKGSPAKRKKYLVHFTKEINDDLNTPKALAVMWEVIKDDKLSDKDKHFLLVAFDEIFGLGLKELKKEKSEIPEEVKMLAEQRLVARIGKDWKKADELREKIKELGYNLGDTKDGYEITRL